jgi:hypothetical protein
MYFCVNRKGKLEDGFMEKTEHPENQENQEKPEAGA